MKELISPLLIKMAPRKDRTEEQNRASNLLALLRGLVFFSLLGIWFFVYRCTDFRQYLTGDRIALTLAYSHKIVADLGIVGPVLFVVVGFMAMMTNVPALVIIPFSVLVFGKVAGIVLSFIIVGIGITLIYFVAQMFGRPLLQFLFKTKLQRVEERFVGKGLRSVIYLRLIFFLSPALNWTLGASGVSYRNYLLGTIIGVAHNIILAAWFSGMLVESIEGGASLSPLRTPKLFLPICIGLVIYLAIRGIDRMRDAGKKAGPN